MKRTRKVKLGHVQGAREESKRKKRRLEEEKGRRLATVGHRLRSQQEEDPDQKRVNKTRRDVKREERSVGRGETKSCGRPTQCLPTLPGPRPLPRKRPMMSPGQGVACNLVVFRKPLVPPHGSSERERRLKHLEFETTVWVPLEGCVTNRCKRGQHSLVSGY